MSKQPAITPSPQLRGHPRQLHQAKLLRALRTAAVTRHEQCLAVRLATQLAWMHGIRPHETTLVPWLTLQPCASNASALTHWVRHTMRTLDPALETDEPASLAALSDRLGQLLADLEEAQPW